MGAVWAVVASMAALYMVVLLGPRSWVDMR